MMFYLEYNYRSQLMKILSVAYEAKSTERTIGIFFLVFSLKSYQRKTASIQTRYLYFTIAIQYNINQSMEADESSQPPQYSAENIFYDQLPFRIEGQQLQELAHRSIVALTFLNVHKKIGAGSGVLISKDTILTVAHNIYQRALRTKNTNFKVYIGASGVGEEYYQVEGWRYPHQFESCPSSAQLAFDYAILKLKKPVDFHQFMPLFPACQKEDLIKENQQTMLEVYGYPRVYPPGYKGTIQPFMDNFQALDQFGKQIRLYQYGLARLGRIAVVDVSQLKIGYGVSTLPGQSGSPVIIGNTIIAVHVGGENGKAFNVGRIVDETLLKNISEWGKQLNAASFIVDEPKIAKQSQQKSRNIKTQGILETSKHQIPKKTNSEIKPVDNSKQVKPKKSNGETYLHKMRWGQPRIDLQQFGDLLNLQLWDCNLQQIDLSHCPRLTILNLTSNKLQKIELIHCPHLTKLNLGNNQLQQVDLNNCSSLMVLYLYENKLQKIDLKNNKHLTQLSLAFNQLQNIDVSASSGLTKLFLSSNRIVQLDVAKHTKLQQLQLKKNRLERVRLCIIDKVKEEMYNNFPFYMSDQQSAACRVQLTYEAQCNKVYILQHDQFLFLIEGVQRTGSKLTYHLRINRKQQGLPNNGRKNTILHFYQSFKTYSIYIDVHTALKQLDLSISINYNSCLTQYREIFSKQPQRRIKIQINHIQIVKILNLRYAYKVEFQKKKSLKVSLSFQNQKPYPINVSFKEVFYVNLQVIDSSISLKTIDDNIEQSLDFRKKLDMIVGEQYKTSEKKQSSIFAL